MSFFAVLFALLIEQLQPLPQGNPVYRAMRGWTAWVGRNFNAGRPPHGIVVWGITVLVPTLAVFLIDALLADISSILILVWHVAILYLTLGFRQFSRNFTEIREALEMGDELKAAELLARWKQWPTAALSRTDLVRTLIEYSAISAHRHVFGVFFWYVVASALGLGPAGAVFYRMTEFTARRWAEDEDAQRGRENGGQLIAVTRVMFYWVDWLPARITAIGFAIVGSFEDAIACWRQYASNWPGTNDGVILAATAGAVGVQLGGNWSPDAPPVADTTDSGEPPQVPVTPGLPAQIGHLTSVVGLVWRSMLLWMIMLALLTLAHILG